jgi:hypothetical protein
VASLPVNELAMNLAADRVDDGYLQFLVVAQAAVTHMLRKLLAVLNRSALPGNSMPTRSRRPGTIAIFRGLNLRRS